MVKFITEKLLVSRIVDNGDDLLDAMNHVSIKTGVMIDYKRAEEVFEELKSGGIIK